MSLEKKILHIDRNPFYGGEGASLNLTTLWKYFRSGSDAPTYLGANREWNIDLIPKFVMSNGNFFKYFFNSKNFVYEGKLVKILLKTKVSKYLEWKSIDGTYVYQYQKGGIFSKGGPTICKVLMKHNLF